MSRQGTKTSWHAAGQGNGLAPSRLAQGRTRRTRRPAVPFTTRRSTELRRGPTPGRQARQRSPNYLSLDKVETHYRSQPPPQLRHGLARQRRRIRNLGAMVRPRKPDSVNAYVHTDLTAKERGLEQRTPPNTKAGRYRTSLSEHLPGQATPGVGPTTGQPNAAPPCRAGLERSFATTIVAAAGPVVASAQPKVRV